MTVNVVILAAGKGTRMYSTTPKVLHRIGGKPMLHHVIDTSLQCHAESIQVVIGYQAEQIQDYFADQDVSQRLNWVMQEEQLGTGHAVQQAVPHLDCDSDDRVVLVLYGDVPLVKAETLKRLLALTDQQTPAILTLVTGNPAGLGRMVRDASGELVAIVEEKDATEDQKKITEINSGIMAIPARRLKGWLSNLKNDNKQAEYYLTDIVSMAVSDGCRVESEIIHDEVEVQGVNDKRQLAQLERHYQQGLLEQLMAKGTTMRDPGRVDIRGSLECGKEVEIDVNVVFEGAVSLQDNVYIGPNCVIKDAVIRSGARIFAGTNIEGAEVGCDAQIGPSARLRPGTVLADQVKIGNFVETKNARFGKGSKANHLAYIGDATIGEGCNIGAGTIFCNYDGAHKHHTTLGDNVFIGSNSVLVAPVEIESGGFVAAGSSINMKVPSDNLAVARGRQRNIEGWKRPVKDQGK